LIKEDGHTPFQGGKNCIKETLNHSHRPCWKKKEKETPKEGELFLREKSSQLIMGSAKKNN